MPATARPPECILSVDSIELVKIELVDRPMGPTVRVRLRNLSEEAVIGIEFEIRGSDPHSSSSLVELTQLRNTSCPPVIEPKGEHVLDIPAASFEIDDKLRLAAVLFASGRGEGDVELVDEMRREAPSSHPPVLPDRSPN